MRWPFRWILDMSDRELISIAINNKIHTLEVSWVPTALQQHYSALTIMDFCTMMYFSLALLKMHAHNRFQYKLQVCEYSGISL